MDISDNCPTTEITIQGFEFTVPQPYAEGHVLKANEARALNQTFAENLRNNFASTVADAKEEAEKSGKAVNVEALQEALDKYVEGYEFNVRRTGTRAAVDPIRNEAEKLARAAIRKQAAKKNIDTKSFTDEQWEKLVADALTKYPVLLEEGAKIVNSRKAIEGLQLE